VATDRPGCDRPGFDDGVEWIPADLTDPEQIPPLVRGVDSVIHTAAWVDISVPFTEQAPINLYAVQHLYEAACDEGVERFVHFSTGSLYAPKRGPIFEDDPLHPTSAYELTKLLAEDYLQARVSTGPQVTILRPALIYGPRGKVLVAPAATVPPMLKPIDGWIPQLVGGPSTNMVHSLDVARAAVHLLYCSRSDGAIYNVACEDVISLGELAETVLEVGGLTAGPGLPFPKTLVRVLLPLLGYSMPVRLLNQAVGLVWKHIVQKEGLRAELTPRVDVEAMPYLVGDVVFDARKLLDTGFEFRFKTFCEGWRDTVRWYRENRWLPPEKAEQMRDVAA
jgi:nucleoside-diphosphate-sugar epimerase